ncbi:MAG: hypothetical protein NTW75_05035 [Planctomycetales bacterium]|jgi:hypothetical protein|nr:hypothetical protein [Planctomycetales bacterium]
MILTFVGSEQSGHHGLPRSMFRGRILDRLYQTKRDANRVAADELVGDAASPSRNLGHIWRFALMAPQTWIVVARAALWLGPFPLDRIASCRVRRTSVWYASYGLLLWNVSSDVTHHN